MASVIRLLYVDDEPSLLDIGKLFLEESGNFSVTTVVSAAAALSLLKSEPFDVIVSDYQMPGMDGIRFLIEVRKVFGHIPFILFTGRGREEIVIQAINSGVDFYLQKGGDPSSQFAELSHKIKAAVTQRTNELAFKESEERFRAISEYSHTAICIIDEQAKIVWANDRMQALGGYSPDQLYSTESFVGFLAPESVEFVVSNFSKVLAGEPYEHHYSFNFIRADGEKRLCEKHMMDVVNSHGQRNLIISMLDVTDRKKAEDALKRQSVTLSILNNIICTANKADSLPQLLDSILSESLHLLDFDAGGIYLVDHSTRTANVVHSKNLPPDLLAEIQTVPIDKNPYDTLFIKNEPIITENYEQISSERSKKYGFLSMISIPLISKGVAIGALNVTSKRRQVISEEEKQTLFSIGRELGSTIERMAAEEELKKSAKNLETLFNSIEEMVFVLDMQGQILSVNDAVLQLLLYTSEELKGTNVLLLHVPERRDEALRNVQEMIAGNIDSCHVPVLAKDGTLIEVETKVTRGWWNGSEVLIGVMRDITERKLAEVELKKSEQKFRSLVEYSLEGILILDFSGNILFANSAAARIIEVEDAAVISGRNVMEFIAPESREDVIKDFIQVAHGHDAYIAHYHAITAKGKKISLESIGKVITYEGKPADLLSVRDITEQKKVKDALLESSRKYTELFELGSEAVFLIDNETGAILEANTAASEMYGYSRDVILTLKNTDLSAETEESQKFTTQTPEGTIRLLVRHHRRGDGTVFPVEIIRRFFTWNGRPVYIAAIRDITERKRAEEDLKESHDRFEQISAQSREIIWEVDPDGLFTYVSPASCAITGFTPEELIKKKHFYDLYPKEEREAFKASILEAFSEKRAISDFLVILQTKDGQKVWMSTSAMPFFDDYNNFLGYRGSGNDITERKTAEEIRTRFGRILESSLNEIYFFDAQTLRFVDVNHGARENIGYTMDELRTMTPLDITTEYTKESFENLLTPLRTGEKDIQVIFTDHKRKDGSFYPIEVHLQLAGNEISPLFVAIILDISERRQTEEALRLANWKLNLLSGITRHDINNQMTVLRGYLSILGMKETDPAISEYIQKMDASAQRISSMIQFTKEYEDLGISQPTWQDIRTLVTNAAKEISFGKIQLKNDLPAGMEIFSEPLIFKVFYNLIDNAVRYGETITTIRFFVKNRNGDRIIVCEDDGVGVPESEKEKIFLRGFGKNTGLGLALSQEILEITGISIEETGEPGKGARFEMTVLKGMWRFVDGK